MRNLQDNWPSVLLAVAGGVLLSIGNLATQYAFAFVGLSVTEVITASITVVIGTSSFTYQMQFPRLPLSGLWRVLFFKNCKLKTFSVLI